MKKHFVLLLLILLFFTMSGCEQKNIVGNVIKPYANNLGNQDNFGSSFNNEMDFSTVVVGGKKCVIGGTVSDYFSKQPIDGLTVKVGKVNDVLMGSEIDLVFDETKTDMAGQYCLTRLSEVVVNSDMSGYLLEIGNNESERYKSYGRYIEGGELPMQEDVILSRGVEEVLSMDDLQVVVRKRLQAEVEKNYDYLWEIMHRDSKKQWKDKEEFEYYWNKKREDEKKAMFDMVSLDKIDETVNFCPTVEIIDSWYSDGNDKIYSKIYKFSLGHHVRDRTYRYGMYEDQYYEKIGEDYYFVMPVKKNQIVDVVDKYDENIVEMYNRSVVDSAYQMGSEKYQLWLELREKIVAVSGYSFNDKGWANSAHLGGDPTPYCKGDN